MIELPLSLPEAVQRHALKTPAALAFEWLEGDNAEPIRRLTYHELHELSGALARSLLGQVKRGERVLLPFPPGLDFIVAFVGCLQAGVIPVATPFPQNRRTFGRTQAILDDCEPALCVTPQKWLASLQERLRFGTSAKSPVPCCAFEQLCEAGRGGPPAEFSAPPRSSSDTAYLQYTSGSGGTAKGVKISHANLRHNIETLQIAAYQSPNRPLLSWLPHYHDMQLVVILARSMMIGARCILMSPVDFIQRPVRWLKAIARSGAYISGGPNFAYEHCVQRVAAEDLAGLDLSHWKIAFNSSESLRPQTLRRFETLVADCGFAPTAWYPAYGLAEATAFVTGVAVGDALTTRTNPQSGQPVISCGRPANGDRVSIIDPANGAPSMDGQIGEICVAGLGITAGYWRRPEAAADLFYRPSDTGENQDRAWLRTGDLGFLDETGRLFFTGRIKDLLVIRGLKHHSEELEASLQGCHPALRTGELVIFSADREGQTREQLVVMAELARTARHEPPLDEIAQAIQVILSREHDLALDHLVLLSPSTLPKTTSGKIQRGVIRSRYLAGDLPVIAQWRRTA